MYDIATLILLVMVGLFVGILIMLIGFKLWLFMKYMPQYTEPDDWPEEDWVIGVEVDDES